MDLNGPNYYRHSQSSLLAINGESPSVIDGSNSTTTFYVKSKANNSSNNPFEDGFGLSDPLCKLNLKETADFVRSFPMPTNTNTSNNGFEKRRESFSGVNSAALTRRMEANNTLMMMPSTPGRPVFSFSSSRKGSFPSKWDDAEKWVSGGGGSCHESPSHHAFSVGYSNKPSYSEISKSSRQSDGSKHHQSDGFVEKSRVSVDKKAPTREAAQQSFNSTSSSSSSGSASAVSSSLDRQSSAPSSNGVLVILKDKFTNDVADPFMPNLKYSMPTKEGFVFGGKGVFEHMKDAATTMVVREVKHKDVGTEMTPLGSSTTSRCHTPFKSFSPARHNTPENRSGPLALLDSNSATKAIDFSQLQDCHLAKLNLVKPFDSVASNWSSREEEEEEVSKSLRHFEITDGFRRSVSESRACCAWEEEEKNKSCLRYQREEAKIQAWVNLQSAKAEAQSRKLEVKIQKMRSDLEEKLMKRMAVVHRKAKEWRAAAQLQHSEQIRKATDRGLNKMNSTQQHRSRPAGLMCCSNDTYNTTTNTTHTISCGCFPCNNHLQL